MVLSRVRLKDFRNYSALEMELSDSLNLLTGSNAQGKTNLLEAVHLCALGRSHRTAQDSQLIRWQASPPEALTRVEVEYPHTRRSVQVQVFAKEKKKVWVDDLPVRKLGEMMGVAPAVLFSPEDLNLVQQGPAVRRRYIDILISQIYPKYFYALQRYMRALRQRNAALHRGDIKVLASFDQQLAVCGVEILCLRTRVLEQLAQQLTEIHSGWTGEKTLRATYAACLPSGESVQMQQQYYQALQNSLPGDLRHGATRFGIHREDVRLYIDEKPARSYASQGQQRSIAISLRLAQCCVMQQCSQERPVLLLDDVLSELDGQRQRRLIAAVAPFQTLLTCTYVQPELLEGIPVQQYAVENGQIRMIASYH